MVAVWRWCRARSIASSASGSRDGAKAFSNSPTPPGTQAMPPSSRQATDTYAAIGTSAIGGSSANNTPASSNAGPIHMLRACGAALPRPFKACAGARRCALRAGSQPPMTAAATPSSP